MAGNFQVSSKLNDGRIFVIAGETYSEFKANLTSLLGEMDAESMLTTMAASLVGPTSSGGQVYSIPTSGVQGTPGLPTSQPSVPSMEMANANIAAAFPGSTVVATHAPTAKICAHGEMTKRSGTGPKGPWKAFMCPSPKGTPNQCDPVWVRRNEPEWSTF